MREKIQINARVMQSLNQLHMKTKRGSNSKKEEECRYHEIRYDHGRVGYSRSARGTHRHHSPPYSSRNFYASEYSISIPEVSSYNMSKRWLIWRLRWIWSFTRIFVSKISSKCSGSRNGGWTHHNSYMIERGHGIGAMPPSLTRLSSASPISCLSYCPC
jgi:hypothetical protein